MRPPALVLFCALLAATAGSSGVPADAEDPVALVRSSFVAPAPAGRQALAARIASHPEYQPSRLRVWLHAAAPFEPLAPAFHELRVDVGSGETRAVTLIVPDRYRPDRAWPLVYALHPSGVPAGRWASQVQRTLGRRAGEFVIASPEHQQNYIAARPPFVPEHPAILDAVARRAHVAPDRVRPYGYSKGGFGAWFVALDYPDRVAGAVAMAAGFDGAPGDDDRTIDWHRPVTLEVDGVVAFRGPVARDAAVALSRARATMDFEALRFAGIRVDPSGRASLVTAEALPEPAWRAGRSEP